MATLDAVKEYLSITEDEVEADAFISACLIQAVLFVDNYVGVAQVPEEILDLAYTIVAADLYYRREAPNGVMNQQFVSADGIPTTPVRIARDPLAGVHKMLSRWVMPF